MCSRSEDGSENSARTSMRFKFENSALNRSASDDLLKSTQTHKTNKLSIVTMGPIYKILHDYLTISFIIVRQYYNSNLIEYVTNAHNIK